MVSVTVLLATAASFWGGVAPAGAIEQACPDGVRYNVKPLAQMDNHGRATTAAEARYGSCVITFRAGWRKRFSDYGACGVVIHEYGHAVLSLRHEAGGIMAQNDGKRRPPGICRQFPND